MAVGSKSMLLTAFVYSPTARVGVVYPVENNRIHVFQYDMLFYHSLNFAANLSIKF